MINSIQLSALLFLSLVKCAEFENQPKSNQMTISCPIHKVEIKNRSTKTIRIEAVRWLESTKEKWISLPVNQPLIEAGADWSGEIELTGLNSSETFIDAQYQIMQDLRSGTWSATQATSQRHVATCHEDTATEIKIVDLRD